MCVIKMHECIIIALMEEENGKWIMPRQGVKKTASKKIKGHAIKIM